MNAEGYVTDVGYTAGFYREMAPSHLALAAVLAGFSPGRALRPKRVLELGFGQGFGLALLAAANPDVEFEGRDANAEHVVYARRLIDGAELSNIAVSQGRFEDAAARGGDNDVDVIALHGVLSWISREAQDAVVAVARQRLRPDGLLYVSYNCMPGWAPMAPIRELALEVGRRTGGGAEQQLQLALDLLAGLRQRGAVYFTANPAAARHLEGMLGMDRRYLVHEYLGEHWNPLSFAEVASRMAEAELSYATSATLTENLDLCSVPRDVLPLLSQAYDPILRETLRDFGANKQFRRDIYSRGRGPLTEDALRQILSTLGFALVVPRRRIVFRFPGPLTVLNGNPELYAPIADALAAGTATFDQLLALPAFGESRTGMLMECLTLLVHSGQVLPVMPGMGADAAPAKRFNRMVIDQVRAGRVFDNLASPVARTGIPLTDFGLLALVAVQDGAAVEVGAVAQHGLDLLKKLNRRPLKNGKPIESDREAANFLAEYMQPLIDESVPLWRRLGML